MLIGGERTVKLLLSDYVRDYYKDQGIEFILRQQAYLCWNYYSLLKDQLKSLKDILSIHPAGYDGKREVITIGLQRLPLYQDSV